MTCSFCPPVSFGNVYADGVTLASSVISRLLSLYWKPLKDVCLDRKQCFSQLLTAMIGPPCKVNFLEFSLTFWLLWVDAVQ